MSDNKIEDNNGFSFSIKSVKDVSFFVNERLLDNSKKVKLQLAQFTGVNIDNNLVNFTLRIFMHYEDTPQEIFANMEVENIFVVPDLKKISTEKEDYLPDSFIIAIISISISHGRALLSRNLAGTVYQDAILPLLNPKEVAKHLFPKMFESKGVVPQQEPSKTKKRPLPASGKNISKNSY